MSVRPAIDALVTNVNTGGQWIVVQTVTSRHGPFVSQAAAEEFKRALLDSPAFPRKDHS